MKNDPCRTHEPKLCASRPYVRGGWWKRRFVLHVLLLSISPASRRRDTSKRVNKFDFAGWVRTASETDVIYTTSKTRHNSDLYIYFSFIFCCSPPREFIRGKRHLPLFKDLAGLSLSSDTLPLNSNKMVTNHPVTEPLQETMLLWGSSPITKGQINWLEILECVHMDLVTRVRSCSGWCLHAYLRRRLSCLFETTWDHRGLLWVQHR